MADDEEALTRADRGRFQARRSKYPRSPQSWLPGILHSQNPRIKVSKASSDKPRNLAGRGWFRAASGADWEPETAADDSPSNTPRQNTFAHMRMLDGDGGTSYDTPRASTIDTYSRLSPSGSDTASTTRFDPHAVRGLSYAEHSGPGVIPSIHSQLYSTTSSPSLSPVMTPNESSATVLASRGLMQADHSQTNISVADVVQSGPFSESQPNLRRFEGGTKFIEGL
ncbi:hypothetical protein CPC08DRAFT_464723 [Agrocybe pediades]|nr:hypothetical protein CPC08DRAFT_464723 [Agrocybe pediades]